MTLPKTYDDMVLIYPWTAYVYWGSMFTSGVLLTSIAMHFLDGVIAFVLMTIGLAGMAFPMFTMMTSTIPMGVSKRA